MKKLIALALAAVMLLTLAACATETNSDPTEPKQSGFVVASHNPNLDSPFRAIYEENLNTVVEEYKQSGLISEYYAYCSNGDTATQSQQINQCINDGVDILIINPISSTGIDAEIEKALEAGITVVCADCVYSSDKVVCVVNDQYAWAAQQAQFMVDTLGEGAKVVMFNGKQGNSASELRESAYRKVLADGGIEIVFEAYNEWNDATSYQKMSEVISSGIEYDGILSQIALNGILNALEDNNLPYPKAISGDITAGAIRRLCSINEDEEVLPFFCIANPPGIGVTALNIAIALAQGNTIDESVLDENGDIVVVPNWTITYADKDEKVKSLDGLEDTAVATSWMTLDEVKDTFFKK